MVSNYFVSSDKTEIYKTIIQLFRQLKITGISPTLNTSLSIMIHSRSWSIEFWENDFVHPYNQSIAFLDAWEDNIPPSPTTTLLCSQYWWRINTKRDNDIPLCQKTTKASFETRNDNYVDIPLFATTTLPYNQSNYILTYWIQLCISSVMQSLPNQVKQGERTI